MSVEIPQPYLEKIAKLVFIPLSQALAPNAQTWESSPGGIQEMCKSIANELCQTYFLTRRDGQMEVYG